MAKKRTTTKATATKAAKKRMMKGKRTTDGLAIIDRRLYEGRPKRQAQLEQARADDEVAGKIRILRTNAKLSQRELAKLVGTTASVICRLEDADYEGHSFSMLRRIAKAMRMRLELRLIPDQDAA